MSLGGSWNLSPSEGKRAGVKGWRDRSERRIHPAAAVSSPTRFRLPINLPEVVLISNNLPTGGSWEQIANAFRPWNLSPSNGARDGVRVARVLPSIIRTWYYQKAARQPPAALEH